MRPSKSSIGNSCVACAFRAERRFCDLGQEALSVLDSKAVPVAFEPGAIICAEGQAAEGVHIICSGRAKLTASSEDGRTTIVGMAQPGDLIGLPAVISDGEYELTAEAEEPTKTKFLSARDFRRLLETHADVGVRVARVLTHTCQSVLEEMKFVTLSTSIHQRLAKLILQWEGQSAWRPKFRVACTQEEIAQMLGTSRETISRNLSRLRSDGVLEMRGSMWLLRDEAALRRAANGK